MDRQKLFNTFIEKCNGKGRAYKDGGGCLYIPGDGHPGCAIGCQIDNKELRDEISSWERNAGDTTCEDLILKFPQMADILDITNGSDVVFLGRLQTFHDSCESWDGKYLKRSALETFAIRNNLSL